MRRIGIAAVLLMFVASAGAAGRPTGKFFPAAPGRGVPGEYLVVFAPGPPAAEIAAQVADEHAAVVRDTWSHALSGALLVGLDEKRARALANRPDVRWVEENQVVRLDATQTNPPSWGLDRVDQRSLPLDSAYNYDFDGTGVHAYVIDTGIRTTHVDFGGRASADFDVIGDGQNGIDCHGHGTHVAGTVGGAGYGVAKNVQVHAVRVLDCDGFGTFAGVTSGVDWVTANHESPAVANMSLGGGPSPTLDAAVNNSVAAGVFYAVAAGNDDDDACDFSPAAAASAFTVGSTTDSDFRSFFSNFGTCVNIFAPGSSITSAWHTSDSATNTISGTSMASPHVAGAAALLLDETSGLTPTQVASSLTDRATCGVEDKGTGSPNLLLHTLSGPAPECVVPPSCDVTSVKDTSVIGSETHRACRLVEVGPSLAVTGTGSLVLEGGAKVTFFDGFQVASGGTLEVRSCGHSLCTTGPHFEAACHDCVASICAVDSFCCEEEWDSLCVDEVASVCGLTCP